MSINKNVFLIAFIVALTLPIVIACQERTIKPGDVIQITVYEHEELSQVVKVDQKGTIDFPALQELPVDGISLQRFQEILIAQLSRYTERAPLVSVRFVQQYPINVVVLGQVANPGIHTTLNTATIQGAISAAGGFVAGAKLAHITIIRKKEDKNNTFEINLEKFYRSGDVQDLPILEDGDTVIVPGNPLATSVKVLGSVERPGSYDITFQTSLLDVIYIAGGPTSDANLKDVRVTSFVNQKIQEKKINIKKMMKSQNLKSVPIIVPGDVVYIPQRKLTWRKFINVLRDVTSIVVLYYFIIRIDER